MNERTAKYVASGFAAVAALFVPVVTLVDMRPLNTTAVAGATLVFVYFAANPQLLVTPRAEWQQVSRRGTNARIAFVLGAILMIIGFIQAVVIGRAT
jgi:hypothetical protein